MPDMLVAFSCWLWDGYLERQGNTAWVFTSSVALLVEWLPLAFQGITSQILAASQCCAKPYTSRCVSAEGY